ncbi:hypothetical protein [Serratia odorifera]|uniref:hypothetical protein n=1 Tax=Serratia odorifera TaxID=618 RepID=UPI001F541158|nr:hypothetical protein [Serratia odorifera]
MNKVKPYLIDKTIIWRAWLAVKANKGSAGVDGMTIEAFEHNLARNLYKIWNRLSSGCYMPPPVKRVEIPKSDGKNSSIGDPHCQRSGSTDGRQDDTGTAVGPVVQRFFIWLPTGKNRRMMPLHRQKRTAGNTNG